MARTIEYGEKRRQIEQMIASNPKVRNCEISEALFVSPAYVSRIRDRMPHRNYKALRHREAAELVKEINADSALVDWLNDQANAQTSPVLLILGTLKDAMIEDQEAAAALREIQPEQRG